MKFMRLGSKPDCFATVGNITSAISELESDIVLDVDGHKFHLHLFPLLAKCGALNRILTEAVGAGEDEVTLEDFPGSAECFEICAKFCYGITITLNAYNVNAVRCGAEFLKMSEIVEKGNLIHKLEIFLNTSILRGWRDSIICLQSSKDYLPWSEDLKIIDRCIESISSKVVVDPAKVDWSFSYTKAFMAIDHVSVSQSASPAVWNGVQGCPWLAPVPKDWWVQDICDLDMDLFWRVMVAVKAQGVANDLVGEALRVYALRWLPEVSGEQDARLTVDYGEGPSIRHRQMLETIVSLLPAEKGSSSCTFFLKLLKAAIVLNASLQLRANLTKRIGLQLEEASLCDLLLPSFSNESLYDVDLVIRIVEHYLLQNQSPPLSPQERVRTFTPEKRRTRSAENIDYTESRRSTAMTHGSKLIVAKLIDSYLAEISRDPNLPLSKFMQLAESIPDFARPFHDGLYRAVDMYLKEHPGLTKGERKKVCSLMDCRRLSVEACMHAAQNDRLPLRTVVQVLFFEQVRTGATGGFLLSEMPGNIRALLGPESSDELSVANVHAERVRPVSIAGELGWDSMHQDFSTLKGDLASLKTRVADAERERQSFTTSSLKPPKPKGMFSKPKKFFQKLFSKKVSNSASSMESEVNTQNTMFTEGKMSAGRRRRHSIT
ncbi:hypothetical protein KC19_4G251600 [Ceratodon purpureus]|uniref:NPH3 domain-containing protein n=1 Tax=Ceratodon purpureus TaxID=3225 RepID=A0A8T0IF17_CERPU|nr:hypothetical protein KC19_4G251600 [Ceratodon purpureus]